MSIPRFTIYTKSGCGWCDDALEWLEARGYAFDEVNVSEDAAAYAEMKRLSDQTKCPTLVAGNEVLPDFDTDQLEIFLKEHGWLAAK
jgi:glutaredoxin 3